MKKKKLVIIAGVTGTLGSVFFQYYVRDKKSLVVGISRKGIPVSSKELFFPSIYNVDLVSKNEIKAFVQKLPKHEISEVIYIHGVGEFKTEISKIGKVIIEHDKDGDGINDCVHGLVYTALATMVNELRHHYVKQEIAAVTFGSLTDDHEFSCFASFSKSHKKAISFLKEMNKSSGLNAIHAKLSTVLSPSELLARPYVGKVFSDFEYWITPDEVAKAIVAKMGSKGITVLELFKPWPKFSENYFSEKSVIKRRLKELFDK